MPSTHSATKVDSFRVQPLYLETSLLELESPRNLLSTYVLFFFRYPENTIRSARLHRLILSELLRWWNRPLVEINLEFPGFNDHLP